MSEGEAIRWGTALDWAMTLTVATSALILLCIIVSRIVYGHDETGGGALWLHLLSLGVLPLFLLVVANFAVFEYATDVRFCGACHLTMKPYIDDLHNPQSQSLAALHFQNRVAPATECYACHADYGIHGTFEAKMSGLFDAYKYATGTYHLPLKMRVPFENAFCLKCHDRAKRFMAQEIHLEDEKVSRDLRSGKTECVECHSPAHDIPKAKLAARPDG